MDGTTGRASGPPGHRRREDGGPDRRRLADRSRRYDTRARNDAAIGAVEAAAAKAGIRRIAVRCQSRYAEAFRRLIARGYRVRWTDLRMTYEGYPERHAAEGVLLSNWEI